MTHRNSEDSVVRKVGKKQLIGELAFESARLWKRDLNGFVVIPGDVASTYIEFHAHHIDDIAYGRCVDAIGPQAERQLEVVAIRHALDDELECCQVVLPLDIH
ncbi:hypothetical protein DIE11_17320 [Burkholderia sp. Bp9012]|nr:hypothetical protein DIE11_17320 [Burkholderia sp. Bp9012]